VRSIREFLFRLQSFFRRRKIETSLSEEIQSHIEMATEANIAAGMSPQEARYAALREFGGVEQIKERYRDERGIRWLEEFFSDIRFAARSLRKSPGFTAVAILTLALCIGANSAVFSIVHSILLKPYPWRSDRMVCVEDTNSRRGAGLSTINVAQYLDRRNGVSAFEESALFQINAFNLATSESSPVRISGVNVTPSLFSLLQIRPVLGRSFTENDAEVGASKTVILTDGLWRNRFGANPRILETEIWLNGEPHLVIGVLPPGVYFPNPSARLWVPFMFTERQKTERGRNGYEMIARLKRGATIDHAQRELDAIEQANLERFPEWRQRAETEGWRGVVSDYHERMVGSVRRLLWFLQGAAMAVLLIGCANVASLLLARNSTRERELAIRASLGASRGRLMRHLLAESALLFTAGSLAGLVFAGWGISAANQLGIRSLPRSYDVSLDSAVFGLTLLCAVCTGVIFGALPAWSATRRDAVDSLKEAGARATSTRRHISLRSTFVVAEIALALMLVATAGLLMKSFHRLLSVSPGFERENLLTARVEFSRAKYDTTQKQTLLHNELLGRVRALPGVVSVACASNFPFSGGGSASVYEIEDRKRTEGQPMPQASFQMVSPDYFKTLGIPLLRGRMFTEQDVRVNDYVTVIDKFMADRHWPGENPIGKRIIYGTKLLPNSTKSVPAVREIVGVVAVAKSSNLDRPVVRETFYLPTLQHPSSTGALIVKTAGSATQLVSALRAAVETIDRELAIYDIQTMEARLDQSVNRRRSPMLLLSIFAGIALLLAVIGVYGVLAFAVGQRTKEIGVRMALGATAANIVRMILRQGAWLVALGLLLGLGGYSALSTFIRTMLFSVEPTDSAALVIAPATLALVALAACLVPARRATKVDPIVALRAE
jgi:putative ABC transport system permease protein